MRARYINLEKHDKSIGFMDMAELDVLKRAVKGRNEEKGERWGNYQHMER